MNFSALLALIGGLTVAALFLSSVFIIWAIRSARKKYNDSGVVYDKRDFAVSALLRSQIIPAVIFLILVPLTGATILFVGQVILAVVFLSSAFTFIGASYFYPSRVKNLYPKPASAEGAQGRGDGRTRRLAALTIFLVMSVLVTVGEIGSSIIGEIAVLTKSPILLMLQIHPHERQGYYLRIAEKTGDIRVCEKMESPYSSSCFEAVDPEYKKSLETCALYIRSGYVGASASQRECILDKYVYDSFKNGAEVECLVIEKDFFQNPSIEGIVRSCDSVKNLQEVIKSGDPTKCNGFLSGPLMRSSDDASAYMGCLRYFAGTAEWKNACNLFSQGSGTGNRPNAPASYLLREAACPGYEGVPSGSVPKAFKSFNLPPQFSP